MNSRQELGFYVSVATGMALATTVFTMIGGLFAMGGPVEIVGAIVVGALLCGMVAAGVAELASMHPSAPGVRSYLKSAFGDRPSLFITLSYLGFVVAVAGVEANVFAQVVGAVVPGLPPEVTILVLCGGVIAINLRGLELPRSVQLWTTFGCAGATLLSGLVALGAEPSVPDAAFAVRSEATVMPAMVGMAIFLFMGFEWVTPMGLNPRAYEHAIPRSMFLSIALLGATYGLFAIGAARQVEAEALQSSLVPQVLLFERLYGAGGGPLAMAVSFGAVFSTFNAGIMGGARLVFLLGREGCLPGWTSRISEDTGVPVGAVAALGSAATVSALAIRFTRTEVPVAIAGAVIVSLVYSAFVFAVPRLRSTRPKARRPFRSPFPDGVHHALGLLMMVLAGLTLVGDPDHFQGAAAGLAVALSLPLGWTLLRRSPAAADGAR